MNATSIVLITISSLSLITSSATLALILVGAKKMQTEVTEVKLKTNRSIANLKDALDELEL